jgi:UDP-N-acetyl-2-amino-2-deoxyglucuronate dehydrogenase
MDMDYGIGIVGTGLVAEMHARAIAESKGVALVSVLSRSAERAASFAARHGCSGFSTAREFFADPRLDIVSICTPPGDRGRQACPDRETLGGHP